MDPRLRTQVLGDEVPIDHRPAELLDPEMDAHVDAVRRWSGGLEEALSYALFPQVATEFFNARADSRLPTTAEPPPETLSTRLDTVSATPTEGARELSIELDGVTSVVHVETTPGSSGMRVFIDGHPFDVTIKSRRKRRRSADSNQDDIDGDGVVSVQMPGTLMEYRVAQGDRVTSGQVVAVLEAMKMQNEIQSPCDGIVRELVSTPGQNIEANQPLMVITPDPASD